MKNPACLRKSHRMPLSVLTNICELAEIGTVQKNAHLVDLETCATIVVDTTENEPDVDV